MAEDYGFTPDEMAVNENLGYPKAYARLCRNKALGSYSHGPPFTYMPYALQEDEVRKWISTLHHSFAWFYDKD